MPTTASRFAEISISLYAHEGAFRIEVPQDEDFESMAQAFERKGCRVERDPLDRALTVTASS